MSLADQIKKSVEDTRDKQAKAKAEEERIRLAKRERMQDNFNGLEEHFEKNIRSLTDLTIKGEHLRVILTRYENMKYSLPQWEIRLNERTLARVALVVIWENCHSGRRYDDGHYDEEWHEEYAGVETTLGNGRNSSWRYSQDALKALSEFMTDLVVKEDD